MTNLHRAVCFTFREFQYIRDFKGDNRGNCYNASKGIIAEADGFCFGFFDLCNLQQAVLRIKSPGSGFVGALERIMVVWLLLAA
jgi:hypothetical protein